MGWNWCRMGVAVVLATASAAPATAADMGLRGAIPGAVEPLPSQPNWGGLYGGFHFGVGNQQFDMQQAARTEAARQLTGLTYESTTGQTPLSQQILIDPMRTSTAMLGAFFGYQFQIEDFVVGAEIDWMRLTRGQAATGTYVAPSGTLFPSTGFTDSVRQAASVTSRLDEYFTVRGRLGYAFGRVMPYLTGGIAVGRGSTTVTYSSAVNRTDTSATDGVDWTANFTLRNGVRTSGTAYAFGLAAGAGIEALLSSYLFMRAEYQFVRFNNLAGVPITMHNARLGVAVKY